MYGHLHLLVLMSYHIIACHFFFKVCSASNRTFVREVDYATETAVDFNPQWVASSLSFSGNARRCGAGYDPCAWGLSHLCRISMRFH